MTGDEDEDDEDEVINMSLVSLPAAMFAVTERLWVLYTVACRVNHWCSFCFCFVFLFLFLQSSRSVLF